MRQLKFNVVMYAPSLASLQKTLASKKIIAEIQPATKTKKQKLVDYLWNITCPNDDYTTEQTAAAVLKALKETPSELIDNIYINPKDEDSNIVIVQHMELKFTVKEICNMAGI